MPTRAGDWRTSLFHFGQRFEVARHRLPVGVGHPFAAAGAESTGVQLAGQLRRYRGFMAFEPHVEVLPQLLPAAEILLEGFIARRRTAVLVLFRRRSAAAVLRLR